MDAGTERVCRGAFSQIVGKFTGHFFHPILKNLAKYDCVLKIVDATQVEQLLKMQNIPEYFHISIHFLGNYFIFQRAIKFRSGKKLLLGPRIEIFMRIFFFFVGYDALAFWQIVQHHPLSLSGKDMKAPTYFSFCTRNFCIEFLIFVFFYFVRARCEGGERLLIVLNRINELNLLADIH